MLRRLIGEDVELRTVLHPELWRVKADPGQVEQVLMNLAVNARDAMPQGGTLTIETANVYLDAAYATSHANITPGDYVVLIVSDSGIGMDPETQAHIFEPFFTTKERGKGTGLGLATVYGIVKQSGGYIWVYSEPGRGATFKIYFPRVEAEAEPRRPTEVPTEIRKGTETILLVEDEAAVRELAARVLQSNGYKVLVASDPEEAVRVCQEYKEPVHLLLTDVVMPKLSGRQLADHVVFIRPEMKVLFMSGYTDDTIAHRGVIQEGAAFLEKPFTPESLLRKVRGVLAQ
jgi:CheY-like chemotaxis protein